MGAKRFRATCATWGVEITANLAYQAVDAYRRKYRRVKKFWNAVMRCALAAVVHPGKTYGYHGCNFKVVEDRVGKSWLAFTLPSKRTLYYSEPRLSTSKFGEVVRHKGIDPYTKKWSWLSLTPGRLTENTCQAVARDIMAHGMLEVHKRLPQIKLIGTVHDEAIGLFDVSDFTDDLQSQFDKTLCSLPTWAREPYSIPLVAKGYISERYKKD
jgi:hypothetical protein